MTAKEQISYFLEVSADEFYLLGFFPVLLTHPRVFGRGKKGKEEKWVFVTSLNVMLTQIKA
jgi:hypothetical protein